MRLRSSFLPWLLLASAASAEPQLPLELEGVGVTERVGSRVDLGLTFIAENGYSTPLSNFVTGHRPVLLNLVYYRCPMLCNLVLNAQVTALRQIPWTPGREFEVVTISIDPNETFQLARDKKALYLASYEKPAPGWHFLADQNGNVKKLAAQLGFHYRWDPRLGQFAHSAAIMLLTPDGRISRYLYGIRFNPRDVRLGLTEASEGKLTSTVDQLLLFCYHYDPSARGYVLFATNFMRAGGIVVVLVLGAALLHLWRRERLSAAAPNLVNAK
jgi:protein SCO1/2